LRRLLAVAHGTRAGIRHAVEGADCERRMSEWPWLAGLAALSVIVWLLLLGGLWWLASVLSL
jgi:hypothetical protein